MSATPVTLPAPILHLDGVRLGRLLRAGIQRLLADQEHLNKINVFPVADGDTGTNMAMTMSAVLNSLRRGGDSHAGNMLTRVADAALDGARGNSGAILAQFLLGVGDSAATLPTLSTTQFASAMTAGASYARESLAEPREGTVLTVIAEFARETSRLAGMNAVKDFFALFNQGLATTRRALRNTSDQLDELRKAGVVDAGAQGFVDLLEGMVEHFRQGIDTEPAADAMLPVAEAHEAAAGEESDLAQRYCTECTVTGENIDRRKLREALAALGSSLVLAGTARKAKIHIHVNEPSAVFQVAEQYGVVSAQKADDMHRQQQAAHATGRRTVVVTDSVADIPDSALEQLDIHVIALRVHFGEHSYLDKVALSPEAFVDELVRNPLHPTTSQPPAGDFRRQFEFLSSHFEGVVSVNVTTKVSGTYNAALTAAERANSAAGRIQVVDSLNASIGQGLLAMYAAECAARGLDAASVVAMTKAMIPRTRSFALVGSLAYAVRGGRLKPAVKSLADALRLTPVLSTHADGRIAAGGVLFGRKNLHAKFVRFIRRRMASDQAYRIGIGHANAEAAARELQSLLQRAHPHIQSCFLTPLGSALSVHGGPGTLVVGIQEVT
jgi:hypothetical protein